QTRTAPAERLSGALRYSACGSARNAASGCPARCPALAARRPTAPRPAGSAPTGAAAARHQEQPVPNATAAHATNPRQAEHPPHPAQVRPPGPPTTPGPKFMTTSGARSLDDTHDREGLLSGVVSVDVC